MDQLLRDALLVFLDRRVLPEVLALVLHPKRAPCAQTRAVSLVSPGGWTTLRVDWRLVEVWTLLAEEGIVATSGAVESPEVPLTRSTDPFDADPAVSGRNRHRKV